MLPGLRHPAKLNEIISGVLTVRRDPGGCCCHSKSPPFSTSHRIAPTQQYPLLMTKKRTILPHSFNFLYCPLFSQQTTRARRRVRTLLGWGATPGNPMVGISLPAPWPGRLRAPQRKQREKWVCVHSRMQGARAARPPPQPSGCGSPLGSRTWRHPPGDAAEDDGSFQEEHRTVSPLLTTSGSFSVSSPPPSVPSLFVCLAALNILPSSTAQLYCGHLPGDPGPLTRPPVRVSPRTAG